VASAKCLKIKKKKALYAGIPVTRTKTQLEYQGRPAMTFAGSPPRKTSLLLNTMTSLVTPVPASVKTPEGKADGGRPVAVLGHRAAALVALDRGICVK